MYVVQKLTAILAKTTRTVGSNAEDLLKKQELCLKDMEGYYPY